MSAVHPSKTPVLRAYYDSIALQAGIVDNSASLVTRAGRAEGKNGPAASELGPRCCVMVRGDCLWTA
jgi:hypothetical protein